MLWVPPTGYRRLVTNYGTPSTTPGDSIADPATANTKSSWSSLGTLTADAHLLRFGFYDYHATSSNNRCLVDIGVDTSGGTSYSVVIANLLAGYAAVTDVGARGYQFPLYVPSGSQIGWRMQGARTNDTIRVLFDALGAEGTPDWVATTVDSYGPDTANSGAVNVDCGNSGADGTWTEITSATARDHLGLITALQPRGGATITGLGYNFDIATGGAGSEALLIADCEVALTTTSEAIATFPRGQMFWTDIPSGTRLSMRGSCSGSTEGMDCAIYGLS